MGLLILVGSPFLNHISRHGKCGSTGTVCSITGNGFKNPHLKNNFCLI